MRLDDISAGRTTSLACFWSVSNVLAGVFFISVAADNHQGRQLYPPTRQLIVLSWNLALSASLLKTFFIQSKNLNAAVGCFFLYRWWQLRAIVGYFLVSLPIVFYISCLLVRVVQGRIWVISYTIIQTNELQANGMIKCEMRSQL